MRSTIRHAIFAAGLALTPFAAVAFAFTWPLALWLAVYGSVKQSAPNGQGDATHHSPADDSRNLLPGTETELVPKHAGSHASAAKI